MERIGKIRLKMKHWRCLLTMLLVLMVSLGVEAKKVKLSKSIIYEGEVQNGKPKGQGCLTISSYLDSKVTLLTLSGKFDNTTVREASFKVNGGLEITADVVEYDKIVTSSKKIDAIQFRLDYCSVKSGTGIMVEGIGRLKLGCRCDLKGDKKWHFYVDANSMQLFQSPTNDVSGVISSNFKNYAPILSVIAEDSSTIIKQDVWINFFTLASENVEEGLDIYLNNVLETYLSSGITIDHNYNGSVNVKYPNSGYITLTRGGGIIGYKLMLNGGSVENDAIGTTITYDNGTIFTSLNPKPFETAGHFIASCKNISDIRLLNGRLSYKDGRDELYDEGTVIAKEFHLKDGGCYTERRSGLNRLAYLNGDVFFASTVNGIMPLKDVSCDNTCEDYTLVNGLLAKANGDTLFFQNSKRQLRNYRDLRDIAFPVKYEKGYLGRIDYVELNHRAYDGNTIKTSNIRELQSLVNKDVAGYFRIEDVKTDLQKRVFSQTQGYQHTYLPQMQEERKFLFSDEYMVSIPVKAEFTDFNEFTFNVKTNRFNFEIRDTENKSVNAGCKDFHFLLLEHLCLTYPRSLVSMTIGKNWFGETLYVQKGQTCKVKDEEAVKVENNISDCEIVWVFKFETVKKDKIYGKTTKLYIQNRKTGEIYCDLSESLKASQSGFRSTKVIKDNQTYHTRGRKEICVFCNGSGEIKSWRDGSYNRCFNCGGKGWQIEHYW